MHILHIFKITCRLLLLILVPLLLLAPVITVTLAPLKSLAAEPLSGYTLTININPANAGTVTLSPPQPQDGYPSGTAVTLTADPTLSPYQFDHWSGDITATYYEATITMDSAKNVNAHFISTPLKRVLDQIQSEVNVQRGLSPLQEINHWFITRDELEQMFIDEFEEDTGDIAISQEILVLLDLLEEDQDLYTILVDLYSEAVLGMYDSDLAKLYIIGDIEQFDAMEEITYAHEYTHALQDQNFDIRSLDSDSEDNSELSMAVSSLVEGDANLLEAIYYWNVFDDAEREAYDQQQAQAGNGIYDDVPQFIIEDLMFPYSAGEDFIYTIWQDGGGWEDGGGWDAVDDIYSNLPQSTEQIIHPEKYLEQDEPQTVTIPDLESALGGTWSQLDTDIFGELYMRLYLEAFIETDQATKASEGWGGDQYVYLKDASDNKLLVISSVWDSTGDAHEFFDAYIDFMEEKNDGTWDLLKKDTGKRWWQNGNSNIYLSQSGEDLLLVIAPDNTVMKQVLTEFPGFYTPGEEQEEETGEAGGCGCSSIGLGISATELIAGWGIIGLCWGGGYWVVRRYGKRKI